MKWVLSADLGQSIDPTAVCVLQCFTLTDIVRELERTPGHKLPAGIRYGFFRSEAFRGFLDEHDRPLDGERITRIDVRYLERLPLKMPYPAQVEVIAGMLRRQPLLGAAELVIDSTGVGRAVTDFFRRAGLRPKAVTITAGDGESHAGGDDYRVSKLVLVSRLQALLHAGELRIAAKMAEAKTLVLELQDFRATYSEATGYARFGAREGQHDDLVLSCAIGAWWASRPSPTLRFEPLTI